jgi:hypothetical protein
MSEVRWGIVGPGAIANNFADGLAECQSGRLVAIASRDAARRQAFGDKHGVAVRHDSYDALFADPGVDAVYVSTPHPWHAELAIRAMRAGKAVLVEKPAGLNEAEVTTLTEVAAQEGVFFMEAFMYRCHPQIARVLEVIASGEIGTVEHVATRFGFNAGFRADSRLRLLHPPGSLSGDRLWQNSCFELFVAESGASAYREFNFSANGQWAQFRFADYRQPAIVASFEAGDAAGGDDRLRSSCHFGSDTFRLSLCLPESLWTSAGAGSYQLGFSAVLETADGDKSYWALCHPGEAPDFHRREAFAHPLSLPWQRLIHSRRVNPP